MTDSRERVLLDDPVFQLNLVLWMLWQLPPPAPVRAILREAGYVLESMGRRLAPAPAIRQRLLELAGSDPASAPDTLVQGPAGRDWLIIECKKRGFRPTSTTSRQALKLLAVAADLLPALGLSMAGNTRAFVGYLTADEGHEQLATTLSGLAADLEAAGVPAGAGGVLALFRTDEGVAVRSAAGNWPFPASEVFGTARHVIHAPPEEDPRPLYFIPWDPSVTQDEDERAYCRAALLGRVQGHALHRLAHTDVPQRVVLPVEDLLAEATFAASRYWRSRGDLDTTLRLCADYLHGALKSLPQDAAVQVEPNSRHVSLTLGDELARQRALVTLERADPAGRPVMPENEPPLPLPDIER